MPLSTVWSSASTFGEQRFVVTAVLLQGRTLEDKLRVTETPRADRFSTIYGTFRAWRGVKKHSETDWRAEYVSKRAGLAQDADVLDYEDVQHLVIVPK